MTGNLDAAKLDNRTRVAARRVIQAAVPTIGRYRRSSRPLPELLVIGAQRCGTTSLHRLLSSHPQLHAPMAKKGVHYFDLAYARDLNWYRCAFPRLQPGEIAFESSPYYMFHPLIAQRVASDLAEVKVIAVLRDPVERSISHHHRETMRGFESLSLKEAITCEPSRLEHSLEALSASRGATDHAHQHFAYLQRGHYAQQLTRWFDGLGRDRVLVLDVDEVSQAPDRSLGQIADFVGVDPFPSGTRFPFANTYRRPVVDIGTRRILEDYFAGLDHELAKLLGRPVSWRK